MNKYRIFILTLMILSGCTVDRSNDRKLTQLMEEECMDERQTYSEFNRNKSRELLRYECKQYLRFFNEEYMKVGNWRFKETYRPDYFREDLQEDFDDEAWFMVSERLRETYYPGLMSPEDEVKKTILLRQQSSNDPSLERDWEPVLLPVSPYMLGSSKIERAKQATEELIGENLKNKELVDELSNIMIILVKQEGKIYRRRFSDY